jgi:hypothetical protein
MARNPQAVFDRIISGLGLTPHQFERFKEFMKKNCAARGKSTLMEGTRRQLETFGEPFIV